MKKQDKPTIYILRHAEAYNNIDREYPLRDPDLTAEGFLQAAAIEIAAEPDFVAISPMSRTINTAIQALGATVERATVQIWPDLRNAHDRLSSELLPRAVMEAKFPRFDFSECREEADYGPQRPSDVAARAERVRLRVKGLTGAYRRILLVTHRGFCTYLVQGADFTNAECRAYRFAEPAEGLIGQWAINNDSKQRISYGPSLLVPLEETVLGIEELAAN